MIQRIQSLFLLGVVICAIALFFIPLGEKAIADTTTGEVATYTLSLLKVSITKNSETPQLVSNTYALMAVNLVLAALATITIFLFKNRPLQIRLCMMGGLLAMIQLILIFYYSEGMGAATTKPHYLAGVYLVAVQVLLLMFARRSIRKDEMLVRAADRIR